MASSSGSAGGSSMRNDLEEMKKGLRKIGDKSNPTQQKDFQALQTVRQSTCIQVRDRLTDIEKIVSELSKDKASKCHGVIILEYLTWILNNHPQILTAPAVLEGHQKELSEEYQICRGMQGWLISCLIRLLAEHGCNSIHQKVCGIITLLFQSVKYKSLVGYRELLTELLQFLARLGDISRILFVHGEVEMLEQPQDLSFFRWTIHDNGTQRVESPSKDDLESVITDYKPVSISHFCQCFYLQLNLSRILRSLVKHGDLMFAPLIQLHWIILSRQVEEGQLAVKNVSLSVLGCLLEQGMSPAMELLDYFIDLLVGVTRLVLARDEDVAVYEDMPGLEQSLASCYRALFPREEGHSLPVSVVEYVLETFATCLQEFGLQAIESVDLRDVLCQMLASIYNQISVDNARSGDNLAVWIEMINSALIDDLGQCHETNSIERPIAISIHSELKIHLSSWESETEISEEKEAPLLPLMNESSDVSSEDERQGKKTRLSLRQTPKKTGSGTRVGRTTREFGYDVTNKSRTLKKLKLRLGELCMLLGQSEVESKGDILKGIRAGLNIIACNSALAKNTTSFPINSSKSGHGIQVSCLSAGEVKQLTNAWIDVLLMQVEEEREVFLECYLPISESIGVLVSTADLSAYPVLLLHEFVWVLSLRWLSLSSNWLDLKIQGDVSDKDIAALSNAAADKLDPSLTASCIRSLSLFPKEVASKWRLFTLKAAIGDTSDVILGAAVSSLPQFLFHLGFNYHHLVHELLFPLIDSCSDVVAEALASTLGQLACILGKKCSLKRYCSLSNLHLQTIVSCETCQSAESGILTERLSASVVSPFLSLLSRGTKVKLALIESFQNIFWHLDMQSTNSAVTHVVKSCLDLATDQDLDIRIAFSSKIKYLVNCGQPCSDLNIKAVVAKLKIAFVDGKSAADNKLQESVVYMLGQLGRVADGELLLVAVISLLQSLLSSSTLLVSAALVELQEVAADRKLTLKDLYAKFKQPICKFLMEALQDTIQRRPQENLSVISKVARALEFADVKSFISKNLQYLLPHIVRRASKESSLILRAVAKELDKRHRELLVVHFPYVFSFLVRNCSKTDLEKALLYVQRETDIELGNLMKMDYQSNHNELLLYLSENYSAVFSGLMMLAAKDESFKGPRPVERSENMADFLQPRLLGILAFFDSQLLNSHTPLEDKKLALESLKCIMKLMGQKHITGVRVKVMTTLKIGLRYKDDGFPLLSCRAWDCFVRSLEPSALGPMLSQIIITLLPLLHQLPEQVASIFNFLIIENKSAFSEHFHELYFMPDIPELQAVNAILLELKDADCSQPDFRGQLQQALKGVVHESVDVRVHALSNLRAMLQRNRASLHDFVIGSETVDPIVMELITVFLAGCRDSDPKAQSLFGECLGELGAVDPGRMALITSNRKDNKTKFYTDVEDVNFASDLIGHLAHAFRAAGDTRAQDCSAYAIQETLHLYKCKTTGAGEQSQGQQLLARFPEHIQEILLPHLHTKYAPSATALFSNITVKPIYRSRKGKTYKEWVCNWTGYLVNKVKQHKAACVFKACSMTFKHDIRTAIFLLPHVLLHILWESTDTVKMEIQTEILAVLSHAGKVGDKKTSEDSHLSAQTVFSILDHLTKYKQQKSQQLASSQPFPSSKVPGGKAAPVAKNPELQSISRFLEQIPQDLLSSASFECKAYARALMHFEAFMAEHKEDRQQHLGFLQKIYVALDEPDGVSGVTASRRGEPELRDQILDHKSMGKLQDAVACYEKAIQLEPTELRHREGLLNSLMDLGQLNTALIHVNGILTEKCEWTSELNAFRVEACWKLARWDDLEKHLNKEKSTSPDFRVGLGRILLAAKHKNLSEFEKQLRNVRGAQMGPLSAASMEKGSYQRGYEYIVRLHMLSDIERGIKQLVSFDNWQPKTEEGGVLQEWNSRLDITQISGRVQEPLLSMKRNILGLTERCEDLAIQQEIGQCWLQSARVARKAGQLQTAYSSLLSASAYSLPELCLEKAKWLWDKGEGHQALICLQKGVAEHFSQCTSKKKPAERLAHAKALLLIGRYMEDTAISESNSVMKQYKKVVDVNPEWEDGHFYMAKYYDRLMLSFTDKAEKAGEFVVHVIKNFGQSLNYGNQYIYQSMPRLLSLWLEYGAQVSEMEKTKTKSKMEKIENCRQTLTKLNKMIAEFSESLAPYQFLTSFSQLISRICHSHPEVFEQLQEIIAKVIHAFPQQAVWMSMAVSKSSYQMRHVRCQEIFNRAKSLDKHLAKFIQDATKLTDRMLELCNKSVDQGCNVLSINRDFRTLKRLVNDKNFSPIIVPLQASMTVTLPSTTTLGPHKRHDPFPMATIYIWGFDDVVEVLPSLQRPKKIGIHGSNGKLYVMLCKPKDDLRKDNRLMEVNGIINKCLRKDAEARWRQLHITTYAVIPLNEECGLIEWVSNTAGLRHILIRLYKQRGIYMNSKEIKAMFPALQTPLEKKIDMFVNGLLPKFPPVFGEWFLRTFTDPTSWYLSRLAYARTAAVMSMVGYILGLGDRHGENILMDSTNGDCLHVDFNCLFNKGETFDWPERVPFRLTHNMVDGMGPLGYEGAFRKACEVTMKVMRDQKDSLMSVLKTFIHDPLVEWSKPHRGRTSALAETGEIINEKALIHVRDIESRLQGALRNKNKALGLPLSIQGHVDHLIREATSAQNLSQMYVGWAPYM